MDIESVILSRRSVRLYHDRIIEEEKIWKIIEAAVWAPSGKNGQPWKFEIITDKKHIIDISSLCDLKWMRTAPCLVAVYLDKKASYHYIKDVQSCGAAMQNMLLMAQGLGIGSCWVGKVLPEGQDINFLLQVDENLELMGIVVLGYQKGPIISSKRKAIKEFLL